MADRIQSPQLTLLITATLAISGWLVKPAVSVAQAAPGEGAPAVSQSSQVSLQRDVVPVAGRQRSELEVASFGRYALWTQSDRGVALQVVDRMAGPGAWSGEAGRSDGRLDVFLDRGDYLLRTDGPESASGQARLRAVAFEELQPEPVRLVDFKRISAELGDLETRSWWFRVEGADRRVLLEAAGRHLADLRLWRDGAWLVGDAPISQEIEPVPGRPLRLLQLSSKLPPGLYKLSAYGGPSLDWTEDDGTRPFHLRSGVPFAPEAARRRIEISPFGFDRWLVPHGANYFRLETGPDGPAGESTVLEVRGWRPERPFTEGGRRAEIVKENRLPVAVVERSSSSRQAHLVTVQGRAGEPVILQHFRSVERYPFSKSGRHFLSSVHAGGAGDHIEVTAILSRNERDSRLHRRSMDARVLELRRGSSWRSRFNFPAAATLFLKVEEAGIYEIRGGGDAMARLRLEPFFAPGTEPKDYEPPEFRDDGDDWEMGPGFYRLTLEPRRKGLLTLTIRDTEPPAGDAAPGSAPPHRHSAIFGEVSLAVEDGYTFYLNQRPGVRGGLVLRELPLDPEHSLPLVASDATPLALPCEVKRAGTLRAVADDGTAFELSIDGGPWTETVRIEARRAFGLQVRPPSGFETPAAYDLSFEPDLLAALSPLPAMAPDEMQLPDFPRLEPSAPQRFDLERKSRRTFLVQADEAALYRVESTGLLDTEGTMRTRVFPQLERRGGGGSGRNFAVQRYLGPGNYQLTVASVGRSAGRLGVRMARAPVEKGGELRLGVPARGWLDAGSAVGYRFRLEQRGTYRLRTLGLSEAFRVRLEDAEGWPLIEPGLRGDVELELEAGEYRYIVLPQEVRARQVTLIEEIPQAVIREGHGPFALGLGEWGEHRWLEPPEGGERVPDRWRFVVPARADVRVELEPEMVAEIHPSEGSASGEALGRANLRRPWRGELPAGSYELRVRSQRVNNRVDYKVRVTPEPLLAGHRTQVTAPASVDLRVGEAALVELWSFGTTDVRARLYGERGELLASGDDRPGDWNFRLARRLDAGAYRLEVESVGAGGPVEVVMGLPTEQVETPWALGSEAAERRVAPGDGAVRLPLELTAGDVVTAGFESPENVRLTLELDGVPVASREGRAGGLWLPLPEPPPPDGRLALRLDSLDQSGNGATVWAAAVTAPRFVEAKLSGGLRLPAAAGLPEGMGLAAVAVAEAGCFRLAGAAVEISVRRGQGPSTLAGGAVVSATEDLLWLAAPADRNLRLERRVLRPGAAVTRLVVPTGGAVCDVEIGEAPAVIEAQGLGAPASLTLDGSFADQAVSGRSALTVATAPGKLRFGVGTPAAPGERDLEVDVSVREVATPSSGISGFGRFAASLEPATSTRLTLPVTDAFSRLRITLSRGLVAMAGGHVFWAASGGEEFLVDGGRSPVLVLDASGGGGGFTTDLATTLEAPSSLAPGRPYERRMARRGVVDLEVPDGGALRVHGGEAIFLGRDGAVRRGQRIETESGGRLLISHQSGLLMAWLDAGDGAGSGLRMSAPVEALTFSKAPRATEPVSKVPGTVPKVPGTASKVPGTDGVGARKVPGTASDEGARKVPGTVSDEGAPKVPGTFGVGTRVVGLEGRARVFSLDLEVPAVISLRAPLAAVTWVERPDLEGVEQVHPESLALDLALPAGRSMLGLRGVAGASLHGALEVTLRTAVRIGEGVGEQILIGPGETRFFTFEMPAAGELGLGVRAESDVLEARLLDAAGGLVGRGVVQWHELSAGRYLLALELAPNQAPVLARPALVGLEAPGTGPPRDVLETYLRLAPRLGEGEE